MNLCSICPCDCPCLSQTKTQIILYPNHTKMNSNRFMPKFLPKSNRIRPKTIQSSNILSNFSNNNILSIQNESEDINNIQERLKLTIDSVTRIGSVPSTSFGPRRKNHHPILEQDQFYEQVNIKQISKKIHKRNKSHEIQSQKIMIIMEQENKQNEDFSHNIECGNRKQKIKTSGRNLVLGNIEKNMKRYISPSCSQLPSLNNTNRSMIFSPKQNDITERLLYRENQQLRHELELLKKQQKQLLRQQQLIREKNDRQYHSLKHKSEQLRATSKMRKKQLEQIQQIIDMLSAKKQGTVIKGNFKKVKRNDAL